MWWMSMHFDRRVNKIVLDSTTLHYRWYTNYKSKNTPIELAQMVHSSIEHELFKSNANEVGQIKCALPTHTKPYWYLSTLLCKYQILIFDFVVFGFWDLVPVLHYSFEAILLSYILLVHRPSNRNPSCLFIRSICWINSIYSISIIWYWMGLLVQSRPLPSPLSYLPVSYDILDFMVFVLDDDAFESVWTFIYKPTFHSE